MLNKAILIGRLVVDPELKTTPQGVSVATARIAIDRPFTPKGAEKKSDFINVVFWRQQAEFVSRFFTKGRLIGVEGSIQTRDYTDKEGAKRYMTEIVADKAFFVDSKSSGGEGTSGSFAAHPQPAGGEVSYNNTSVGDFAPVDDGDDDLPF